MNRSDLTRTFARVAALAAPVILAACASKPLPPPAPAPAPVAAPAPAPAPAAAPAPAPAPAPVPAWLDPNNPISQQRSVFFGFDRYDVVGDGKKVIELQGPFLAQHPDVHVRVEGNTDERGGAEYNLALGQKRAEAVKSALAIYGVKEGQVEPVSYGKERPKASGHDEDSWSQNRRADIVYPSN